MKTKKTLALALCVSLIVHAGSALGQGAGVSGANPYEAFMARFVAMCAQWGAPLPEEAPAVLESDGHTITFGQYGLVVEAEPDENDALGIVRISLAHGSQIDHDTLIKEMAVVGALEYDAPETSQQWCSLFRSASAVINRALGVLRSEVGSGQDGKAIPVLPGMVNAYSYRTTGDGAVFEVEIVK